MKIIYVLTLKLHVKSNLKIKMSSEDRSVSVSMESTEDEFGDDMETENFAENTVNSGDGKTVIQHKPIKKPRKPKLPKDPQAPKKPLRYKGK